MGKRFFFILFFCISATNWSLHGMKPNRNQQKRIPNKSVIMFKVSEIKSSNGQLFEFKPIRIDILGKEDDPYTFEQEKKLQAFFCLLEKSEITLLLPKDERVEAMFSIEALKKIAKSSPFSSFHIYPLFYKNDNILEILEKLNKEPETKSYLPIGMKKFQAILCRQYECMKDIRQLDTQGLVVRRTHSFNPQSKCEAN